MNNWLWRIAIDVGNPAHEAALLQWLPPAIAEDVARLYLTKTGTRNGVYYDPESCRAFILSHAEEDDSKVVCVMFEGIRDMEQAVEIWRDMQQGTHHFEAYTRATGIALHPPIVSRH